MAAPAENPTLYGFVCHFDRANELIEVPATDYVDNPPGYNEAGAAFATVGKYYNILAISAAAVGVGFSVALILGNWFISKMKHRYLRNVRAGPAMKGVVKAIAITLAVTVE